MVKFTPSFNRLVGEFAKLPGIGRKTAVRLTLFMLRQTSQDALALGEAVRELKERTRFCSRCFYFTEEDPCPLCTDVGRDDQLICVVEEPQDVIAIERSRSFRGRYHVLHGSLSPLDGIGPDDLKIDALLERLQQNNVKEVLLATNFDVEGEATALYLAKVIQPFGVKVTRLAHGIPTGSDLEYVDEATVNHAVEGRREL
ncbi:recombination protein RecR [Syntrophotalea carbinolica DSM 2380]|uniref:Recombination protein RecR n=1 Tax=Syntrophotalea carbinolica (strain DSM 2380 / NBRC 103641 / GraBd1) TaxID=338963 RepID=RECR_SYNC1|nr:recombination mediator RecR [Syntrophotalea carbinolica]Q3A7K8.1 RecName: Full=Recombination protein RecR [Syntrophotalea carbinolica DSM 2380]ABA87636.1 recombination protein RecR [Syntrophotalea carbinolica DSM 2380]